MVDEIDLFVTKHNMGFGDYIYAKISETRLCARR
jgi:hypothetical protein